MNHRESAASHARIALLVGVACVQLLLVLSPLIELGKTAEVLRDEHDALRRGLQVAPVLAATQFFLLYLASSTLLLPGAALLSLTAGAVFGLPWGVAIASLASTLGGTVGMLVSRGLFADWAGQRAPAALRRIVDALDRQPVAWLLAARLVPFVPFWLVNAVFGLTRISARRFMAVSWIGMLPGSAAYVAIGTTVADRQMPEVVVSPMQLTAAWTLWVLTAAGMVAAAVAIHRDRTAQRTRDDDRA
jgi:uncharacterized membrane protein YdjX (TVP38/TMEM64 family)